MEKGEGSQKLNAVFAKQSVRGQQGHIEQKQGLTASAEDNLVPEVAEQQEESELPQVAGQEGSQALEVAEKDDEEKKEEKKEEEGKEKGDEEKEEDEKEKEKKEREKERE